jgi:hypothetical protein
MRLEAPVQLVGVEQEVDCHIGAAADLHGLAHKVLVLEAHGGQLRDA